MCSGGFSPGHAMDMILTGRGVSGDEAQRMGLTNRLVGPGEALEAAIELANQLAAFPQHCMRADRRSAVEQWGLDVDQTLRNETRIGLEVIRSGETAEGTRRFAEACGWRGHRVDKRRELSEVLEPTFQDEGLSLVVIPIDYRENPLLKEHLGAITCPI